jgi:hypothetical protein
VAKSFVLNLANVMQNKKDKNKIHIEIKDFLKILKKPLFCDLDLEENK